MIPNTCILVIDLQKDFISKDGFYATRDHGMQRIQEAFSTIKEILPKLTQKYHLIYIYSEFEDKQFGPNKSICLKGSKGSELAIDTHLASRIFVKHEWSAFSNPQFTSYLQKNNFTHLVVMGLLTEYCINATVLDALEQGFAVTLLANCIATGDDKVKIHQEIIESLQHEGALIKTVRDLL